MKSHAAYTLVEALIALSIVTILASLALPGLRHMQDAGREEIFRGEILRAIEVARTEAYARSTPVVLCKSSDHHGCGGKWEEGYLVFINQNVDGVVHDQADIVSVKNTQSHRGALYWRSFPFYRDYLVFIPTGFDAGDNGTFWHCHDGESKWAIRLSKTGQTHVVTPDEHGVIKDGRGEVLPC